MRGQGRSKEEWKALGRVKDVDNERNISGDIFLENKRQRNE